MKKRIFAVLMAFVLTLGMTVTVFAEPGGGAFPRPRSAPICPPPVVCPPPDAV